MIVDRSLAKDLIANEIYFRQDIFVAGDGVRVEKSTRAHGDVVRVIEISKVDHKTMVAKEIDG